jgi:hypothetical protein
MRLLVYARLQWNSDQLNESYDPVSLHWCSVQMTRHAFQGEQPDACACLDDKVVSAAVEGGKRRVDGPFAGGQSNHPNGHVGVGHFVSRDDSSAATGMGSIRIALTLRE